MPYTLSELKDIANVLSVLDEEELDYVFEGHARVNRRKNLMRHSKPLSARERRINQREKMRHKDFAPHDKAAVRRFK